MSRNQHNLTLSAQSGVHNGKEQLKIFTDNTIHYSSIHFYSVLYISFIVSICEILLYLIIRFIFV